MALNWEKERLRRKMQKLDEINWPKRGRRIPFELKKFFDAAIEKTKGTPQWGPALSLQAQYVKRGFLSRKQGAYLKNLSGLSSALPALLLASRRPSGPAPQAGKGCRGQIKKRKKI